MKLTREKLIRQFVSTNKLVVSLSLLSSFISSMGSVLLPLSIGIYYQLAFHEDSGKSEILHRIGLDIPSIDGFFWFFALLTLTKGLMVWSENYGMRIIEERFTRHIRHLLFHAQLNHQFTAFESKPVGKYILRYSSDMLAIQYYLSKGIIKSISDFAFLIVAFGLLYRINATLTLALICIFLSGAGIMLLLTKLQEAPNESRRSARSSLIGFIEQRLHAFATIKAFNRMHPEELKFEKRNNRYYKSAVDFHAISALNKSLPQVIFFAAIGLLLFLALRASDSATTPDGSLLVFILMLLYLQSVYKRLLRVPSILNAGATSFKNLVALLNLEHEGMHFKITAKEIRNVRSIRFEHVGFYFNADEPIIRKVNAQFNKGHISRIDGASGSGKSTILKLILKLYRPTDGSIWLDNFELDELGAHDLRKQISVVGEDFPLLGNTIFEAISYSRKEAKKEDAARVVEQLGLAAPGGGMTFIERKIKSFGSDLSSVERRLLQFARALLTNKPILLLDEPFLGLHEEHEQKLADAIMHIKENHLIILISNHIPANITIDQTIRL